MPDDKKRVELPTLEEIDAELAELAERRKWLSRVRRLVAQIGEPRPGAEGDEA